MPWMHLLKVRHSDVSTVKQIQITHTKHVEEQEKTPGVQINEKTNNVFHEKGDHDGRFSHG